MSLTYVNKGSKYPYLSRLAETLGGYYGKKRFGNQPGDPNGTTVPKGAAAGSVVGAAAGEARTESAEGQAVLDALTKQIKPWDLARFLSLAASMGPFAALHVLGYSYLIPLLKSGSQQLGDAQDIRDMGTHGPVFE